MSLEFVSDLIIKLKFYIQAFDHYLSETNHLRMISMILMLLALVLFLMLIVIVYIRSIIYLVKSNNPAKRMNYGEGKVSEEADDVAFFDDDEQQELERELQKELEIALANQQALEKSAEEEFQEERQKNIKKQQENEKLEKDIKEKEEKAISYLKVEKNGINLDWKKGKIPPAEAKQLAEISKISLSYQQSKKELNQLIGLLIDMLGRGVDDLKIAQTLNFKSQGLNDENDILKTIDAIKQFINLCISGKFIKLPRYKDLPKEEQALYHLSQGDASLALALLENLMDAEIDKANAGVSEEKRQKLYALVSDYACCFGALAELNDVMLATTSYELAIELYSANVVAWSRLGDAYKRANSNSRAVWAYQNVVNFADSEIDVALLANANKHLSENLYAEGNSLQAAKLYNAAKQYYDSLGISRRLDKQEIEIIEIIENGYQKALPETIKKLLSNSNQQG